MNRRFWNGPGDGEIMRHAGVLKVELCREEDGDITGEFELRGYFGRSARAEAWGLPTDDDAAEFAKNLLAQFQRAKPAGGAML